MAKARCRVSQSAKAAYLLTRSLCHLRQGTKLSVARIIDIICRLAMAKMHSFTSHSLTMLGHIAVERYDSWLHTDTRTIVAKSNSNAYDTNFKMLAKNIICGSCARIVELRTTTRCLKSFCPCMSYPMICGKKWKPKSTISVTSDWVYSNKLRQVACAPTASCIREAHRDIHTFFPYAPWAILRKTFALEPLLGDSIRVDT